MEQGLLFVRKKRVKKWSEREYVQRERSSRRFSLWWFWSKQREQQRERERKVSEMCEENREKKATKAKEGGDRRLLLTVDPLTGAPPCSHLRRRARIDATRRQQRSATQRLSCSCSVSFRQKPPPRASSPWRCTTRELTLLRLHPPLIEPSYAWATPGLVAELPSDDAIAPHLCSCPSHWSSSPFDPLLRFQQRSRFCLRPSRATAPLCRSLPLLQLDPTTATFV